MHIYIYPYNNAMSKINIFLDNASWKLGASIFSPLFKWGSSNFFSASQVGLANFSPDIWKKRPPPPPGLGSSMNIIDYLFIIELDGDIHNHNCIRCFKIVCIHNHIHIRAQRIIFIIIIVPARFHLIRFVCHSFCHTETVCWVDSAVNKHEVMITGIVWLLSNCELTVSSA